MTIIQRAQNMRAGDENGNFVKMEGQGAFEKREEVSKMQIVENIIGLTI